MIRILTDTLYIWKQELKVVFKDPAVLLIFIFVPIIYPLIYSYVYNNEVPRNVAVIAVDESHSALSRQFIRHLDGTPDVAIVGHATNIEEAKAKIYSREAFGILYIPRDFSKKIYRDEIAQVMMYSDMNSLLYYKNINLAANEVALHMGANIRVERLHHKSRSEDIVIGNRVESEWIAMFNPSNGFASFLLPAVLVLVIQQTLLLGIATLLGTHNDKKAFRLASHTIQGKNVNALILTVGKAFAYGTVYSVISLWIFGIVPYIFNFPQVGDPWTILVFLQPYLLAATFFAMTLSYFCSQREFGILMFAFTSILFIFLSGVSWPWVAVPAELKSIAYIFPSTPGIHGFIKINTMGATLADVKKEYTALWIEAIFYFITATLMYVWWIKNYDPKNIGGMKEKGILHKLWGFFGFSHL